MMCGNMIPALIKKPRPSSHGSIVYRRFDDTGSNGLPWWRVGGVDSKYDLREVRIDPAIGT